MSEPAVTLPAVNECMLRAQWQEVVFAEKLRRGDLLGLKPEFLLQPVRVRVHRNQPFEFVAAPMGPFLAFAGYSAEYVYSAYDDSLAVGDASPAGVEIVWLDYSRYENAGGFPPWLRQRLLALRNLSDAPILLANRPSPDGQWGDFNRSLQEVAADIPGVRLCDLTPLVDRLGEAYFDRRVAGLAATTLSGEACVELARLFGLRWIPAALNVRIKAIALDLDNTLYDGVLGEDGTAGIHLREAHLALQRQLLELREAGIFLAIVSRNDPRDVERMFSERQDILLRPQHLSAQSVDWNAKARGIERAAAALRIAPDAFLVIDDNPGELAAIASELPGIRALHASSPELVCRALRVYPGLNLDPAGETDLLRIADLEASGRRAALQAQSVDPSDYLRSLGIQLSFSYKPMGQLPRLHELSNKTNQFNTAFLRFSETEVARYLEDPERFAVAIALQDKLSDSGLIAALFGRYTDGLTVDEVVISCRALGRGIETVMIIEALRGVVARSGRGAPSCVTFRYTRGPRNQPAANWLEQFVRPNELTDLVQVEYCWREWDIMIQNVAPTMSILWIDR